MRTHSFSTLRFIERRPLNTYKHKHKHPRVSAPLAQHNAPAPRGRNHRAPRPDTLPLPVVHGALRHRGAGPARARNRRVHPPVVVARRPRVARDLDGALGATLGFLKKTRPRVSWFQVFWVPIKARYHSTNTHTTPREKTRPRVSWFRVTQKTRPWVS